MRILLLSILIGCNLLAKAQLPIPVPMAQQPALTYLETFDSILTWSNDFVSGQGAERYTSVPIGGVAAIPDANRITTSSASFVTAQMSGGGLYKDTVNGRILLLVTGTSNNTNSLAFDLHLDFTGKLAGNLSFDWATVFNGTPSSNRTGTLKVYASTNGATFTELTTAAITITNNIAANGIVNNIQLPSSFDNSATARLRFYYYNSAGGSSGSRPAIALDNISTTAIGNPCVLPTAAPSALSFPQVTATSIQGLYASASPSPDEYLVVATNLGALNALPADSTSYKVGDIIGDGTVIYVGNDTNFFYNNLNPLTTYTFYIFSCNKFCNGTIRYLSSNPLVGMQTTPAGPPCIAPTLAPTNLQFSNITTTAINGSFSPSPDATEYLVIRSTNISLISMPIDTVNYKAGDLLGGGEVVYRGGATNFVATNLQHSTTYYFFVFGLNNFACSGGPLYQKMSPLTASQNTKILYPCLAPAEDATNLILLPSTQSISGFFNPGNPNTDGFLVIQSTSSSLGAVPQNGTSYTKGMSIGNGTIIATGKAYSFTATNLSTNSHYYYFIYPYNEICTNGPIYKTTNLLQGDTSTTNTVAYNYYFGNLHSHSSYSDGNKDDVTKIPYDDYDYAKNSLCMDFLGISEHNHYTSAGNPGMTLAKYSLGIAQADSFTQNNTGFLALYGMEWGTQTNGGHSLVYGIDSLIGWETLNGQPNYSIYVPKNDYTSSQGLLQKVNTYASSNAFVTLAHPSFSDYQNLAFNPYNASYDSAMVGVALESGPAFSTITNYTSPGSNMEFLGYYLHLLAKGYHLAPMIDHDNHYMTFGRTASTRTAVISPSMAKKDFYQAMRSRMFYATQDCDTRVQFHIYGQPMGTIMTHEFAPAIHINVDDPTNLLDTPIIRIMAGNPGSGILPVELASSKNYFINYTDHTLLPTTTAYYYADILQGGKRTISAPIWYQRIIDPPLSLNDFATASTNNLQASLVTNPINDDLLLSTYTSTSGALQMIVYNMMGQEIKTYSQILTQGNHQLQIALPNIGSGMYFIELRLGKESVRLKFLK